MYPRIHTQKTSPVWAIFLLALLLLASAHLTVKDFFPNSVFWITGASLIIISCAGWLILRKDDFGLLLAIFVCAHFGFGENQGGLWSYLIIAIVLMKLVLQSNPGFKLSSAPNLINFLIVLFLIHQIIGTLKNPYSLSGNTQATIVIISQLMIFYLFASQKITEFNIKRFLSVWFIVACWAFIMGLNQHYHWVITKSPLLPQRYTIYKEISSIPAGSFGNTELFAEYFCIVLVLSFIIACYNKELSKLKINLIFPIIMTFISVASLMMGASRAAVLLGVAAIAYISVQNMFITSMTSMRRAFASFTIIALAIVMIIFFGSFFALNKMINDFKDLDPQQINTESVISGKGINRSFTPAYYHLKNGSWWFGNGYNVGENNLKSLLIKKHTAADYHSLYVCLPFFYGWIGAAAFVGIILLTGLRIYISYFRGKKYNDLLFPISYGLAIIWGIFLLDQYKISVTRNPSYFLIIWMLLGFSHAVAKAIQENTKSRI